MATTRSKLLRNPVTLHNAVTSLTAPTAGQDAGGVLRTDKGHAEDRGLLCIRAAGAGSFAAGTYATGRVGAQWYFVSYLNDGAAFTLSAAVGFSALLQDVGIFDRLAIVAPSMTGTLTIDYTPIETN